MDPACIGFGLSPKGGLDPCFHLIRRRMTLEGNLILHGDYTCEISNRSFGCVSLEVPRHFALESDDTVSDPGRDAPRYEHVPAQRMLRSDCKVGIDPLVLVDQLDGEILGGRSRARDMSRQRERMR